MATTKQLSELVYLTTVDNSESGEPLDVTLLNFNIETERATQDGVETPLAKWYASRLKLLGSALYISDPTAVAKALIGIQTVVTSATPVISSTLSAPNLPLVATVPAGATLSFVWGMMPSIEGGFLLQSGAGGGGGGGDCTLLNGLVASVEIAQQTITFASALQSVTPLAEISFGNDNQPYAATVSAVLDVFNPSETDAVEVLVAISQTAIDEPVATQSIIVGPTERVSASMTINTQLLADAATTPFYLVAVTLADGQTATVNEAGPFLTVNKLTGIAVPLNTCATFSPILT